MKITIIILIVSIVLVVVGLAIGLGVYFGLYHGKGQSQPVEPGDPTQPPIGCEEYIQTLMGPVCFLSQQPCLPIINMNNEVPIILSQTDINTLMPYFSQIPQPGATEFYISRMITSTEIYMIIAYLADRGLNYPGYDTFLFTLLDTVDNWIGKGFYVANNNVNIIWENGMNQPNQMALSQNLLITFPLPPNWCSLQPPTKPPTQPPPTQPPPTTQPPTTQPPTTQPPPTQPPSTTQPPTGVPMSTGKRYRIYNATQVGCGNFGVFYENDIFPIAFVIIWNQNGACTTGGVWGGDLSQFTLLPSNVLDPSKLHYGDEVELQSNSSLFNPSGQVFSINNNYKICIEPSVGEENRNPIVVTEQPPLFAFPTYRLLNPKNFNDRGIIYEGSEILMKDYFNYTGSIQPIVHGCSQTYGEPIQYSRPSNRQYALCFGTQPVDEINVKDEQIFSFSP